MSTVQSHGVFSTKTAVVQKWLLWYHECCRLPSSNLQQKETFDPFPSKGSGSTVVNQAINYVAALQSPSLLPPPHLLPTSLMPPLMSPLTSNLGSCQAVEHWYWTGTCAVSPAPVVNLCHIPLPLHFPPTPYAISPVIATVFGPSLYVPHYSDMLRVRRRDIMSIDCCCLIVWKRHWPLWPCADAAHLKQSDWPKWSPTDSI